MILCDPSRLIDRSDKQQDIGDFFVREERKDEVYLVGFRVGDGFFPVGRVSLITQTLSVRSSGENQFLVKQHSISLMAL